MTSADAHTPHSVQMEIVLAGEGSNWSCSCGEDGSGSPRQVLEASLAHIRAPRDDEPEAIRPPLPARIRSALAQALRPVAPYLGAAFIALSLVWMAAALSAGRYPYAAVVIFNGIWISRKLGVARLLGRLPLLHG